MASGGQRDIELETHIGRTVSGEMWYFAKSGAAYVVSEEFTNASAGETATLTLTNPAGSGTTLQMTHEDGLIDATVLQGSAPVPVDDDAPDVTADADAPRRT